jgi:RNA polymerase sigma factor for flagellar operon FliA
VLDERQRSLATCHVYLVEAIARSMHKHLAKSVLASYGDLVGWGMLGLLDAAKRYGEQVDATFATYASRRIRGAIFDGLREVDPIGRTWRKRVHAWKDTEARLAFELGRMPERREIRQAMGGRVTESEILAEIRHVPIEDVLGQDVLPSSPASDEIVEHSWRKWIEDQIWSALDVLDDRSADIVLAYYFEGRKLREIGCDLGVSEGRVSQLLTAALRRLREAIGEEGSQWARGCDASA